MKSKIACLCMLLSLSSVVSAQPSYTEALTNLITWFRGLDNLVNNIEEGEKLKEMHYTLGYLQTDMDNLALEKVDLSKMVNRYVSGSTTTGADKIFAQLTQVLNALSGMERALRSFNRLVNTSQQTEVSKLASDLESLVIARKRMHLEDLETKLRQGAAFNRDMKMEADKALEVAREASAIIRTAKSKIIEKLGD